MNESTNILLSAGSGTEALRRLLDYQRQINRKWSCAWIAKQLGVASRGHISDMLSGRRVLVKRLWEPTLNLLALDGLQLKYCQLLLKVEEQIMGEAAPDSKDLAQLETTRKLLRGADVRYSERVISDHIVLQVHSAFGLFQNRPTRRQLIQFFGRQHSVEIESALQILSAEGLIERHDDVFILRPEARDVFMLGLQGQPEKIARFLREGLEQSKEAVGRWAQRPDVSVFRTCNISVKRSVFTKKLTEIREEILSLQNEMAQDDGDMLIRFDFQIYPLGEKVEDS